VTHTPVDNLVIKKVDICSLVASVAQIFPPVILHYAGRRLGPWLQLPVFLFIDGVKLLFGGA
jgi:hypothetical protein